MTTSRDQPASTGDDDEEHDLGSHIAPTGGRQGERRWPMATAVLSVGVLQELIPDDFRILPRYAYPLALLCFMVVLVIGDPGRIDRQRRWLRVTTLLMFGLITLVTATAAVRLVAGIFTDAAFTTASQLLVIGGCIWLTNAIAFALWYWDLDAGGAASRAAATQPTRPAFIFPEMTMREYVHESWYPTFPDYLVLSFNTALAFSPTDVSAVRVWAKLMMIVESMVSLSLAALVIARAINIL
ncbi:hypothetical protein ACVBEQ_22775 [Nakamurella sp. GG22]